MRAAVFFAAVIGCGSIAVAQAADESIGTRIIGDEEAALGLTITPWQEENPVEMDRPPLLLEPGTEKINAAELKSRVRTQQTISAFRRSGVDPR